MEKEIAELLKELIRIESMSGEEEELAAFVGARLVRSGMDLDTDRHGNLYAVYQFGNEGEGPVILFNTHLDNVPVGAGWETDPFAACEKDGIIYGRGACDPKGALAAMIVACERTIRKAKAGRRFSGKLLLMGATTEEISPPGAKGTWKAMRDGYVKADMAICGEPTGNIPCIGEFGKMEYEIIVHGRPAHASAPEKGVNAIIYLAEILTALNNQAERRWSALLGRKGTMNVGLITGGVQINIVPETAKAMVERRLVPGQTAEASIEEMKRICDGLAERLPDLNYEIRVTGEGNPAVIDEEEPVARMMADSVEAVTGKRPEAQGFVAHADADWLITYGGIPTVIYGPGALSDAHTCHEQVKISDVEEAADVLTDFLSRALG